MMHYRDFYKLKILKIILMNNSENGPELLRPDFNVNSISCLEDFFSRSENLAELEEGRCPVFESFEDLVNPGILGRYVYYVPEIVARNGSNHINLKPGHIARGRFVPKNDRYYGFFYSQHRKDRFVGFLKVESAR